MTSLFRSTLAALTLGAVSTLAHADYTVRCKSSDFRYETCRLREPGYVTVDRQISSNDCRRGRSWDYDRREIWVDRGCEAEFRVETQDNHRGGGKGGAAAGALVGAVVLGAIIANRNAVDDQKYRDDNYFGSRHTSYVPPWMIGTFSGYNSVYGVDVTLTIDGDGRVSGSGGDTPVSGYINDQQLHVGQVVFDVSQTREGFVTAQKGDRANEVRYRRVR